MLEYTNQQIPVPFSILEQVDKHGMAKFCGENGHNYYIYPEAKSDNNEIAISFDSVDEFKKYAMKISGQTWEEIEKSASEVED